jgi:hypothetical protein
MSAPKEVLTLIERFADNQGAYRSSEYNETETRREFIDPFFIALDGDIDNEQGCAETCKDLSAKTDHEKSLIKRQIDATDRQIDQLVYELYGLTKEEIRIVEEATRD